MKLPNRDQIRKFKDEALKTRRTYLGGKQEIFESSVASIEAKASSWLFALIFVGVIMLIWLIVLFRPFEIGELNDRFGLVTPAAVVFFSSYFAFFFLSKMLIKPTAEEREDDTSYIALFSACDRRAARGLFAAALGALHTVIFFLYLMRYVLF